MNNGHELSAAIASGKPVLVAEISPPQGADPAPVRAMAKRFAGKVHALGISDNRDEWSDGGAGRRVACRRRGRRADPARRHPRPQPHRPGFRGPGGAGPGHPQRAVHQRHAPDARAASAPRRTSSTSTRSSCSRPTPSWPATCVAGRRRAASTGPARSAWAPWPRPTPIRSNCRCSRLPKKVTAGARVPHHAAGLRPGAVRRLVEGGHAARHPREGGHRGRHPAAGRREELAAGARRQATARRGFPQAMLDRVGVEARRGRPAGGGDRDRRGDDRAAFAASAGCAVSASAATATATPRWKSSRNPDWGATSRACQVRHPYQAGRAPLAARGQAGHRRLARGLLELPQLREAGLRLRPVPRRGRHAPRRNRLPRLHLPVQGLPELRAELHQEHPHPRGQSRVPPAGRRATTRPTSSSPPGFRRRSGRIPVSGAGYGGPFSGPGFDSMWTDMSEIVRPTRDGIHGREYINTSVDIGRKLPHLAFVDGQLAVTPPPLVEMPLPVIFDVIPEHWRRGPVVGGRRRGRGRDRHAGRRPRARHRGRRLPCRVTSFRCWQTADAAAAGTRLRGAAGDDRRPCRGAWRSRRR